MQLCQESTKTETKCGVSCESELSNYDGSLITVSSAIKPRLWWFVHGRPPHPTGL